MSEHCKSCGAHIFWAKTDDRKVMPVDFEPVPDGNLRLVEPPHGAARVTVSPPDLLDQIEPKPKRFKSHFATCPQSETWRKSK